MAPGHPRLHRRPAQRPSQPQTAVRRGDVRMAIIDVLHRARAADEPINGYQVIQEIAELSNGEWRPSPGSVYPTVQQLQDEGLVETDDERGRRTIRLTDAGVTWADANTDELASVWAPFVRAEAPTASRPARRRHQERDRPGRERRVAARHPGLGPAAEGRPRRPRRHPSPPLRHPRGRTGRRAMTAPDPRMRIADSDRERAMADLAMPLRRGTPRPRGVRRTARRDLDRAHPRRPGAALRRPAPSPAALPPRPKPAAPRRSSAWQRLPLLPMLAVLIVLSLLTEAPFWLLVFPLMFMRSRHRGASCAPPHGHADYRRTRGSHG